MYETFRADRLYWSTEIMERVWFIYDESGQSGPFTITEIQSKLRGQIVLPEHLAWKEGMENWQSISTITEFAPAVAVFSTPTGLTAAPSEKDQGFIGQYRIVSELGQGGMGTVYLVELPSTRDRFALKIVPEFLARDPQFIERFRRECSAAKKLKNPGIPGFHAYEKIDGKACMIMEYFEAQPLDEFAIANAAVINYDFVATMLGSVSTILAYAHEQGVIHRDISPKNILVTTDRQFKLIDFGLAKLIDESTLTVTGAHFGTPHYMAPEQFLEKGVKNVSENVDLWSLGVLAFKLATQKLPFDASNNASYIRGITHPNSTASPVTSAAPDIPQRLAEVIDRLLQKNPRHRYQTARELLAALNRPENTDPVGLYESSRTYNVDELVFLPFAKSWAVIKSVGDNNGISYAGMRMHGGTPTIRVMNYLPNPSEALINLTCSECGRAMAAAKFCPSCGRFDPEEYTSVYSAAQAAMNQTFVSSAGRRTVPGTKWRRGRLLAALLLTLALAGTVYYYRLQNSSSAEREPAITSGESDEGEEMSDPETASREFPTDAELADKGEGSSKETKRFLALLENNGMRVKKLKTSDAGRSNYSVNRAIISTRFSKYKKSDHSGAFGIRPATLNFLVENEGFLVSIVEHGRFYFVIPVGDIAEILAASPVYDADGTHRFRVNRESDETWYFRTSTGAVDVTRFYQETRFFTDEDFKPTVKKQVSAEEGLRATGLLLGMESVDPSKRKSTLYVSHIIGNLKKEIPVEKLDFGRNFFKLGDKYHTYVRYGGYNASQYQGAFVTFRSTESFLQFLELDNLYFTVVAQTSEDEVNDLPKVFFIPLSKLPVFTKMMKMGDTRLVFSIAERAGRYLFRSSSGEQFDCTEYLENYDVFRE